MTESQKEQRRTALAQTGGVCEVCGKPLVEGQPQGAHRIGNTKANRQKYGDFVIDHPRGFEIRGDEMRESFVFHAEYNIILKEV